MNEKRYVQLQLLIARMSKWERRLAQIYLNSFYDNYTHTASVYEEMWEYLVEHPDASYPDFKKEVFDQSTEDAVRKNLERLRDKLYESLLLDVNLNRRSEWSASERAKYDSKKLLLKSRMAYSKSIETTTLYYLDKTIKLARKFELLEDWIEALTLKITFISTRRLKINAGKFEKEREKVSYIRDKFISSQAIRQEIISLSNNRSQIKKNLKRMEVLLKEVETYYQKTASPIIGRQLYYSHLALDEVKTDWEAAYQHCLALSQLIDNSPSINNPRELATTQLNMTFFLTLNHDFEDALDALEGIYASIDANGKLYLNALEFQFLNLFYSNRFEDALKTLESLREIESAQGSVELQSKWYYWEACVYFMQGFYKHANKALFETQEIEKDKEGWNLAVRMLRILIYIEMENTDIADSEIENFRRYLEQRNLTKRTKLQVELLKRLRYSAFDFDETARMMAKVREELKQEAWEPFSPELILLEQWFDSKTNGTAFHHQELKKIPVQT